MLNDVSWAVGRIPPVELNPRHVVIRKIENCFRPQPNDLDFGKIKDGRCISSIEDESGKFYLANTSTNTGEFAEATNVTTFGGWTLKAQGGKTQLSAEEEPHYYIV